MITQAVRSQARALDGFAGYTDVVQGREDQHRPTSGVTFVQFNKGQYVTRDGGSLPAGREYIAFDIGREVIKWPPGAERGAPAERIILGAHQPFPDIERKNEDTSRSEWRIDLNGQLVGPWQAQHSVFLLDAVSTQRLVFLTTTSGGHVAVSQLAQRVRDRRELTRVPNLVAVVLLQDKLFSPRFGTLRPHFEPVRFIPFGQTEQQEEVHALTDNTAAADGELPPCEVMMDDKIVY